MRNPFARGQLPPAPPEPDGTPVRVEDVEAAEIAAGSLAGIAPARIVRHVLIVLDDEEDMHITTSCCKHELTRIVTRAAMMALRQAMQPGPCYHQEQP